MNGVKGHKAYLEDRDETQPHQDDADTWHQPKDIRRRRPAEHEHAPREDEAAEHHRRETRLGYRPIVIRLPPSGVEALVGQVDNNRKKDTDEHGQEGKSSDEFVPAAEMLKDERKSSKRGVEEAVDERGVQSDNEANRRK